MVTLTPTLSAKKSHPKHGHTDRGALKSQETDVVHAGPPAPPLTTGVASAMFVDCSSIMSFISLSCSVMRCSSLLRSVMASVRSLYDPYTPAGQHLKVAVMHSTHTPWWHTPPRTHTCQQPGVTHQTNAHAQLTARPMLPLKAHLHLLHLCACSTVLLHEALKQLVQVVLARLQLVQG